MLTDMYFSYVFKTLRKAFSYNKPSFKFESCVKCMKMFAGTKNVTGRSLSFVFHLFYFLSQNSAHSSLNTSFIPFFIDLFDFY